MRSLLRAETGRLLVEAHGGSSVGPPNSWTSIRGGLAAGADLVEVDVQTSRDGIPFLLHNYVLADGRWTHELEWHELRQLDGGVLLLEDVLAWAATAGAFLVLDVKSSFRPFGTVHQAAASLITSMGMVGRVIVSNRDHHEIKAAKQAEPALRTRAALGARLTALGSLITDVLPEAVTMRWDLCHQDDIELAHAMGVAVTFVDGWHPQCVWSAVAMGADAVSWPDPVEASALIRSASRPA